MAVRWCASVDQRTFMPNIPYLPADLAEPKELVEAIRARRGGRLLNLDRMLLYSPPLARGWNAYLGEVRGRLTLAPKLREIAICTVAALTDAEYEFHHHAVELSKVGGTDAQIEVLRALRTAASITDRFDTTENAVIQLTVEMTREVKVREATLAAARQALGGDRQLVELVGVIAAYNMVSRFLVALGVELE
jgi:alkylhydroperoxidase family enzyme